MTESQNSPTDSTDGVPLAYDGICPVCGEEFEDGFDRLDEGESYDVRMCVVEKDGEDAEALFHLPEVTEA